MAVIFPVQLCSGCRPSRVEVGWLFYPPMRSFDLVTATPQCDRLLVCYIETSTKFVDMQRSLALEQ